MRQPNVKKQFFHRDSTKQRVQPLGRARGANKPQASPKCVYLHLIPDQSQGALEQFQTFHADFDRNSRRALLGL